MAYLNVIVFSLLDDGTIKQRITPLAGSEDDSDTLSDAESFSESYSDLADESYGQEDLITLAKIADKKSAENSLENRTSVVSNQHIAQPSKIETTITGRSEGVFIDVNYCYV